MQPPFFCDYGSNIKLGERVFFNFNCVVLDVCPVVIGSFTLFGPAVQIYTPIHPLNAELRRREEFGRPVEMEAGRLGGRRGNHSTRRADRIASGGRCWERGDEEHSRGRVCRWQPMSRDPGKHVMNMSIAASSYRFTRSVTATWSPAAQCSRWDWLLRKH